MDDVSVKGHLQGAHIAGTYAIRSDNTCIFLAADFDKATWKKDALAFKKAAYDVLGL